MTHIQLGLSALLFCSIAAAEAQTVAFPGAEGGGRFTSGGRGGRAIEVTNLNDSGDGSLRAAIQAGGARTVVFRVSGTILLNSTLTISNDSITIAGQTAPGGGICLRRYQLNVNADQVIIRYLRFRLGDEAGGESDAVGGRYHRNIIVDHCSASWSTDETMSFYANDSLTVQWCLISESLYNSSHPKGAHGYAGMWGGDGSSFHHNLIAHHSSRNPRFGAGSPVDSCRGLDFRNNVIYNWGFNSAYGGEFDSVNVVNNYYRSGPATKSGVKNRIVQPSDAVGRWYIAGNYVDGYPLITADNWSGGVQGGFATNPAIRLSTSLVVPPVTTDDPATAYDRVLESAGAILPQRDAVDARIIEEVRNGTVTFGGITYARAQGFDTTKVYGIIDSQTDVGGWPTLESLSPPVDSDHDGMPDEWEIAHMLAPTEAADGQVIQPDGYSNLEHYLNQLAQAGPDGMAESSPGPDEFLLLKNFPNPFNPATVIEYSLPRRSHVMLDVFSLLGSTVATLVDEEQGAGAYQITFSGSHLASGMYFARLRTTEGLLTRRMVLVR